jgi:hypothetical protein
MRACRSCHAYRYRYRKTAKRTRWDTYIQTKSTEVLIRSTTWRLHLAPALSSHKTPQSSHDCRAASFSLRIVPRAVLSASRSFHCPGPGLERIFMLCGTVHAFNRQQYPSQRHNTVISHMSSYITTSRNPPANHQVPLTSYHAPRPTWTISPEYSSIFRACDISPDVSHVVHFAWHLWTWCSPLAVVCSTNTHLSTC